MSSLSVRPHFDRSRPRLFVAAALCAAAVLPPAAQAHSYPMHQVAPGASLTTIAAANGMQVARLAAANGLSWDSPVVAGQLLRIPPADGAYTSPTGQTMGYATSTTPVAQATSASSTASPATTASTSSSSSTSSGASSVRPGDTLSAIAARLGVSLQALATANAISNYNLIISGTTLKHPGATTTVTPAPAAVPASGTVPTSGTVSSSTGPEGRPAYEGAGAGNTSERLSSSQIASIAAQQGVPGSLAAAVAWQESGNNNALTSSTGAKGVMQIMPGTWDWINDNLASPKLQTHSATDNVRAGSLLLKSLLKETGGDENAALAGYYQGLGSVRSRGLYDDTKAYVTNVQALRSRMGG